MKLNNEQPISKHHTDDEYAHLFKDIQGNILKSHARPQVKLFFLVFEAGRDQIRRWIEREIAPLVTSFSEQLRVTEKKKRARVTTVPAAAQRALVVDRDPLFCNFFLTSKGFDKAGLELPADAGGVFTRGMEGGIENDSVRDEWETGYQERIDAMLLLANDHDNIIEQFEPQITASMQGIARVVAVETGRVIKDAENGIELEHFGFADGISQPRFFEEDLTDKDTAAQWDPFASLDLVLLKDPNGTAFADGVTGEPVPAENGEFGFGSYLVFRKLEQNVRAWNEAVETLADTHGLDPEWLGAMAVGRFKDGTPVVLGGTPGSVVPLSNDFNYAADNKGVTCPFHAHIRKTNPREESAAPGNPFGVTKDSERAHRIARRGIPYGRRAGAGEDTPAENVGLLFMCFQRDIASQFEFMQQSWADNESFLNKLFNPSAGSETGIDAVIGQKIDEPIDQIWAKNRGVENDSAAFSFGRFVTLKGGEYFFAPSISALKNL